MGGGKFEEVTEQVGAGFASPKVARGAAYADIDNDGALDILMTTNGGRAVAVPQRRRRESEPACQAGGDEVESRRDWGDGARDFRGDKQWQMLRSGSSYLSQSELVLTFGLGSAGKADSVEVQWPSGQVDKASAIAGDQTVTVEEGKGVTATRAYSHGSSTRDGAGTGKRAKR